MSPAPAPAAALVDVHDLVVRHPDFTLGPLSLALHPGECVALLGPNGSGKTTLLRALAGTVPLAGGHVRVGAATVRTQTPASRQAVGLLAERVPAFPWMRVREHLAFVGQFYARWDQSYADALCDRLALDVGQTMGALSRGNRVKAGFVAAEAPRPPLLILDEPTNGLDPDARAALLDLLTGIPRATGERAVVLATHILEDVLDVATRVVALREGRCVADRPSRDGAPPPGDGLTIPALRRLIGTPAPFRLDDDATGPQSLRAARCA